MREDRSTLDEVTDKTRDCLMDGDSFTSRVPDAHDPARPSWSDRLAAWLGAVIALGVWACALGLALGAW